MVLSQNVFGRTRENHRELHSFTQVPCQNPIQQFTNAKLSDKTLSHVVLYVYLECLWKFVSKIIVYHIYSVLTLTMKCMPQLHLKDSRLPSKLHGVTFRKTVTLIVIAVSTSNVTY